VKILISGSSGLVGSAVVDNLSHQGHDLIRLVRPGTEARQPAAVCELPQVAWNPQSGLLDSRAEGADA